MSSNSLTPAGTPKSIHLVPSWDSGKPPQPFSLSAQEIKALGEGILEGIEQWIALALLNVSFLGVHPFVALQMFGNHVNHTLTDIGSILGNPLGLGTGSFTIPALGDIPLFGELADLDAPDVIAEILNNLRSTQWFLDLKHILGGDPLDLGSGSPSIPSLSDIPLLAGIASQLDPHEILENLEGTQWFIGLKSLLGNPDLDDIDLTPPSLSDIPLLGELSSLNDDDVVGEILANLKATQWFIDLRQLLGNPGGLGTGDLSIPSLSDIPLLGDIQAQLSEILPNIQSEQWYVDLQHLLGDPGGLGTGDIDFPSLSGIPLLGELANLDDDNVVSEILANLKATQWFIDLRNFFGNPDGWGSGSPPALPDLDDIPILGPLLDKVAGRLGAIGADIETRMRNLDNATGEWIDAAKINTIITLDGVATDIETATQGFIDGVNTAVGNAIGLGVETMQDVFSNFPGPNVLHGFGLTGDDAHGLLWDAICNGFGVPGAGHSYADAGNAATAINKQINELINGKKAFVQIYAEAGSGNWDPAASDAAPWMVDGDLLYPVALGGGGGGAGGAAGLPGVGGHAGSWSGTSVTPLVRGTDWHSGDTFDWVVGPGGTGGPTPGTVSSNPGNNSSINVHGGSTVASGSGGAAVIGTSGSTNAWWGDGVSPNTNTVVGTPLNGGVTQKAAGYGGHSSGGAGAGGRRNGIGAPGGGVSGGGDGASGLVAFLAVQA